MSYTHSSPTTFMGGAFSVSSAWTSIQMALSEVAACREGEHAGENIEWILAAVAVIQRVGPVDLPTEMAVRLVLDVLRGRRNVDGALFTLFRGA